MDILKFKRDQYDANNNNMRVSSLLGEGFYARKMLRWQCFFLKS